MTVTLDYVHKGFRVKTEGPTPVIISLLAKRSSALKLRQKYMTGIKRPPTSPNTAEIVLFLSLFFLQVSFSTVIPMVELAASLLFVTANW